jgi:hypothetical protein
LHHSNDGATSNETSHCLYWTLFRPLKLFGLFFSNIDYCRALTVLASGISEATSASGTLSTGTDNVMYETGEPSEGGSMGTRLTAEDECSCML